MRYKLKYDLHTHTVFSHGKGQIEDNVRAGIAKGLKAIGISDHGPGHVSYGIKRSAVPEMRRQITELRDKYKEIEIYLGVEANIINPSGNLDVRRDGYSYGDKYVASGSYGTCDKNFHEI